MIRITRRDFAALAGVALLARKALAQNDAAPLIERAIPSSGERLPAVGLGIARVFEGDGQAAVAFLVDPFEPLFFGAAFAPTLRPSPSDFASSDRRAA